MSDSHGMVSTRETLLDAAEALFARQGFEATTIKEIGVAADLNPALLYYYFGNKEELYRAVLMRIVGELVQRGQARVEAAVSPEDAIRGVVETQVGFLLAHPTAPKLFAREMLDHEARRGEQVILQVAAGLFKRLCEVIESGQRSGVFRPDIEARFAAVSIISQMVYFHLASPAVGLFYGLGPDGITDDILRAFGTHAGEFALAALRARDQESGVRNQGRRTDAG